jgi:hypothetical protein
MEFEDYTAARDLFYLAALFAGAGIGCVLNRFRIKGTRRFRSRAITLALCLFSGMVAALAGALIYSNVLVVFEKPFYIPALIIAVLLILAVRFPRASGFPLILISGCAVIWIGYSFLQFPLINTIGTTGTINAIGTIETINARKSFRVSVSGEGGGQYTARFASGRGVDARQNLLIRIEGGGGPAEGFLEFAFLRLSYPALFPLIGGESRGIVSEIRGGNEVFYTDPRVTGRLRGWYALLQKGIPDASGGRRLEESRQKVPLGDILPGMTLELGFGGS